MEGKEVEAVGLQGDSQVAASATVPAVDQGTEARVVGKERWVEIRRRHAGGQSISAIARELSLDRKTVRYWVRREQWAPYQREAAGEPLLAAHRDWLLERAPQVRYSARILYQELVGQRGFSGSYDTVKLAVRPLRAQAAVTALTQRRFETDPGQQAQVDWDQVKVRFTDGPAVVLGTEEGKPRWNPTFDAFAKHWGFEPRLCRPYRAQT